MADVHAGLQRRAEHVHAMLMKHGVRAELVRGGESSSPRIWVPAQHYGRAMDVMTLVAESGPSPCDACPNEAEGRFDLCWTCEQR